MKTTGRNYSRNPTLLNLQDLKPRPNFKRSAQMSKINPHKNQIAGAVGHP